MRGSCNKVVVVVGQLLARMPVDLESLTLSYSGCFIPRSHSFSVTESPTAHNERTVGAKSLEGTVMHRSMYEPVLNSLATHSHKLSIKIRSLILFGKHSFEIL